MAIGRSLTKKGSRYGLGFSSSEESNSKRNSLSKTQISAPVALISTTNMISYTSPNLRPSQSVSSMSSSSTSSSPTSTKFPSSPFSSGSSSETEATSPPSPEPTMTPPPNHLSTYFSADPTPPPLRSLSTKSLRSATGSTKKASSSTGLSRNNSRNTAWPGQHSKALHSVTRASTQHPFGNELAKVAEMTEEISGSRARDVEEQFMVEHGLQKFSAQDYEDEIWGDMGGVFEDSLPKLTAGWI